LDPFHIFVTLFLLWNVRYLVRFLIFTSLLESSFAFLVSFLCVLLPSFSWLYLSLMKFIRWFVNSFSLLVLSGAQSRFPCLLDHHIPPNSLIFASLAFSVLLEFFFSWSHITYASPNFFSPPWCLQLRKFQNFRFTLLLVDLLCKPLFWESVSYIFPFSLPNNTRFSFRSGFPIHFIVLAFLFLIAIVVEGLWSPVFC
jgi:hypothetical protein